MDFGEWFCHKLDLNTSNHFIVHDHQKRQYTPGGDEPDIQGVLIQLYSRESQLSRARAIARLKMQFLEKKKNKDVNGWVSGWMDEWLSGWVRSVDAKCPCTYRPRLLGNTNPVLSDSRRKPRTCIVTPPVPCNTEIHVFSWRECTVSVLARPPMAVLHLHVL